MFYLYCFIYDIILHTLIPQHVKFNDFTVYAYTFAKIQINLIVSKFNFTIWSRKVEDL